MMMANDSNPSPSGALAGETIAMVRDALDGHVRAPGGDARTLRDALHTLSREARTKGLQPEQVLVVLKETWYALPALREVDEPAEQARLLQRVVTMCIKEYYGE
jgi:hypothetical protein